MVPLLQGSIPARGASAYLRGAAFFLSVILLPAAVVPARADVSLSATAGKENFLYSDLNADVDVSSAVNAGVYYAHYSSDFVSPTAIYSASLSLQVKDLFVTVDGYTSPAARNYSFYGGQMAGGYQGESIGGSVSFTRTLNTLHGVSRAGYMPLHSNSLDTSIDLFLMKSLLLNFSYAFYSYQEDQNEFFTAQFGNPLSLPRIVFAVSGYPSREAHIGMSYYFGENWKLTFDGDRLLFEEFDIQQNSVTWGVTYYAGRFWGISGSYNLINGDLSYVTLGIQWYAHGRRRGREEKPFISYRNIP